MALACARPVEMQFQDRGRQGADGGGKMTKYLVCALALASVSAAWGRNTAKLVAEDGTPPPGTPRVMPDYTFRRVPACFIYNVFGDGTVEYAINWNAYDDRTQLQGDECPVTITLEGFRTTNATLHQGAVIVMKREGDSEGSTVSMTVLNAPKDAKKAYESGVAAMSRKKWAAAQADFERAIGIYPQYAPALSDLGEVLVAQSKPQEARAAWEKALAADPKYVKVYVQLARLALNEKRVEDAARISDRALQLNPTGVPAIYFLNGMAHYNLGHVDVAERAVRRAIEIDINHDVPRAEGLLGSVLATKGDRIGAIEHFRKYLALAPHAPDAAAVGRIVEELERGTAAK